MSDHILKILNKLYKNIDLHVDGSIVYFSAEK